MPQHVFLSGMRLSPRFVISLTISALIHGFIFFGLSGSGTQQVSSLLRPVGKQMFTVDLQPLKDKLPSPVPIDSKTKKRLLSESLSNNHDAKLNKKSLKVSQTDSSDQLLALPEPPYYTLAELDQAPGILKDVSTNPPELLAYPQGGELTIRLWIDEKGAVVKAEIVKSELPEEFDKSALKRFLDAKFSPGIKASLPVRVVAKVVVRYSSAQAVGN
jgi:TonB family protein